MANTIGKFFNEQREYYKGDEEMLEMINEQEKGMNERQQEIFDNSMKRTRDMMKEKTENIMEDMAKEDQKFLAKRIAVSVGSGILVGIAALIAFSE